ncbi:APC family permease [symbiont of Argiope bruennichi]|uniref:APC family permease n=1 Tax=symbiont of Argiope bruennichi TaxID=2810479 RepID=UPI003DA68A16
MNKKYTKIQMMFFGLNFIVGYAFLVGLGSVVKDSGYLFFLVVLICGTIAFSAGLAFARLSSIVDGFGGSYLYAKRAFPKKRFLYFLTGWAQYIQAPFVAVSTITGIAWSFKLASSDTYNFKYFDFDNYKGWIYLAAVIIFCLIIIILNFGFVSTHNSLRIFWTLKWFIIILALGMCIYHLNDFKVNWNKNIFTNKPNSILSIFQALVLFFFAYGGVEGIAAISKDVENSKKNMPRIILWTLVFTTIFYIIFYLLITGAVESKTLSGVDNPNPVNWLISNTFLGVVLGSIFLYLAISSQVANKLTSRLQNGWVNTRLIAPLAADGFLPVLFAKRNKHNQFKYALYLDSAISISIILIYTIFVFTFKSLQDNLDKPMDMYSLIMFFQYFMTCLSAIVLAKKKVLNIKKIEVLFYYVGLVSIAIIQIGYVANIIFDNVGYDGNVSNISKNFYELIPFILYFSSIIVGLILFYVGNKRNWRKDVATIKDADLENSLEHLDLEVAETQFFTEDI